MAKVDLGPIVGERLAQTERDVQWEKTVNFTKFKSKVGDSYKILTIPAGFVFDRADAILLVPEGKATKINIGTDATPGLFVTDGDGNGAALSSLAVPATPTAGTLFKVNTDVVIATDVVAAKAVVKFILRGYVTDLAVAA